MVWRDVKQDNVYAKLEIMWCLLNHPLAVGMSLRNTVKGPFSFSCTGYENNRYL